MIKTILSNSRPTLSFEFFPPKDSEGSALLFDTIKGLTPLSPSFVSVTYGAQGTTRNLTHDLVLKLHKEVGCEVLAHLTCIGASIEEIHQILRQYQDAGITNIMALRGDLPPEVEKKSLSFPFAADLVSYIKREFPTFSIGVAGFPEGHPECPNRLKEIEYLKRKVDAGADFIITQLFFDNHDFYDFCERAELAGIKIPIIAGLMPVTSMKSLDRMASLALCSRFPAKLLKALTRATSEEGVKRVGIQWATGQATDLLNNGVSGVHFYTLNRSESTKKIFTYLGY